MKDVIVIGNGPTGISASLYLNQLNHDVLIIGKDLGILSKNDMIENFYGHPRIDGQTLIQKGIDQAIEAGIDYKKDSVLQINKVDNYFEVITVNAKYLSKTVVIATGNKRLQMRSKGFLVFKGRGIHLCAKCDGFFYKNKSIALIGSGPYMEQELNILENYTSHITIFSNGVQYENSKYAVVTDKIVEFAGEHRLNKIITSENSYDLQGAFVAIGFPKATELALKLGILTDKSNIVVDEKMETNISGVFAGGDCIGGKLQIAKAIFDGLKISDGVHSHLKSIKNKI